MISTSKIEEAKKLATRLHKGQFRKDGKTHYVEHLLAVADILSEYTDDEEIIIAGLMHDSIEDVSGYTHDRLVIDCGERVANIVEGVTQIRYISDHSLSKEEREKVFMNTIKETLQKIEKAGKDSILVACADKIHNLQSMIDGVNEQGKEYLDNFKTPMAQRKYFYQQVLEIAKRNLKSPIVERLEKVFKEAEKIVFV